MSNHVKNITCSSVHEGVAPMYDFILLQMVMPAMLLTFVVYPLPRRAYTYSEYIAIGMEFINAFDTMDMIGDLAFIRHYVISWEVLFYLSLGITAISIAFPIKVESKKSVWKNQFADCSHPPSSQVDMTRLGQSRSNIRELSQNDLTSERAHSPIRIKRESKENTSHNSIVPSENKHLEGPIKSSEITEKPIKPTENQDSISPIERSQPLPERYVITLSKTQKKIVKVFTTVVFTDICFALLRFKIMVEENSAVHGFNMFMKNLILTCLHLSYLLQHVQNFVVISFSQMV